MSSRPFDWRRDCPEDVAPRRWPAITGKGRGRVLNEAAVQGARRKLQGRGLTRQSTST